VRGRTVPVMSRVMLGCVSENGAVETDAMSRGEVEPFAAGSETVNGKEGDVRLKVGGAGSMTVAVARRSSWFVPLDTLKDLRVMSSVMEGKGTLSPGCGSPGRGGTVSFQS